jgi:hypothetical protein
MTTWGEVPVKPTWVTRHVPATDVEWRQPRNPRVGDLLLCEVVSVGIHGRVETPSGSRRRLYPDDRIVCAVANRYATSLLEAVGEVGDDEIDMVSASGMCGRVMRLSKGAGHPTRLRVLGQAFVDGEPLNLRSCVMASPPDTVERDPRWVVVVGSAMDSGKTTACSSIIRGLVASGQSVGAGKVTGSASARDIGSFRDAGADPVVDFLDFGWPSTFGCTESELVHLLDDVAATIRAARVEWGVIEIADGLLQADTRFLVERAVSHLGPTVKVVLTVRESMAAVTGTQVLVECGLDVEAVSGLITNSPLACAEAEDALRRPGLCVSTADLGRRLARMARRAAVPSFPPQDPSGAVTA